MTTSAYGIELTEKQLLDGVRESTLGKEMIAELEERIIAERRSSKKRIDALRAELASGMPPLLKKEAAAESKLEAARKALDAAWQERKDAYAARQAFAGQRQHHIDRLERQLRDGAPELIDDTIREIDRSADRVRRDGLDYSNMADVERSLVSHAQARQAADAMRYEAPDSFVEALADIRSKIVMPGGKS